MTNTHTKHNGGSDVLTSTRNVISVSFDPDNNAYAALTELKELDAQGQLRLESAAVIARTDDGQIVVKDNVGSVDYAGAASGGILGLLIGILGGPLGVLIGGAYGLLVGSLADIGESERSESILGEISDSLKPGQTALLAQLTEPSYDAVDSAMSELHGTVLRRPIVDVEAEIAAAEKAQRHAKREANKELVRSRAEHNKEEVHAKVEELKAKLPHHEKAQTSAS
jgi:uncharacterized membrane protein